MRPLPLLAAGLGLVARAVDVAPTGAFTEMPSSHTGLVFSNHVAAATVMAHATLIASGLAAGDVNGDQLPDLYFCRIDGPNALYLNRGDWKFEDVTARAGPVACPDLHSIGAAFADVDGDGDNDLLVLARGGPNRLFRNDGRAGFAEDPAFPGRASTACSTSAAFADIEGDGDLDLYITNYRAKAWADDHVPGQEDAEVKENSRRLQAGEPVDPAFAAQYFVVGNEVQEKGEPDVLLLNDGRGGFTPAPDGTFGQPDLPPGALDGWGLSAQFRDITGDGAPDLYVCNDFHTPDRLWINDGRGRFRPAPGATLRKSSYYAMAVDFADVNQDGHWDFLVADMLSRDHARRKRQMGNMRSDAPQTNNFSLRPQVTQNTFFANRGDGTFAEISAFAGVKASEWTWGAVFLDHDLDGDPDLITSTGMVHDWMDSDRADELARARPSVREMQEGRLSYPPLRTRNLLFRNKGGFAFEEIGLSAGLTREEISGGLVTADFDGDGDTDVVVSNTGATPEAYRNDSRSPRRAVRLRGAGANTAAVGARARLSGPAPQLAEVVAGGRYASGCDTVLTFALPAGGGPHDLEITWRDGKVTRVADLRPGDTTLVIDEKDAPSAPVTQPAPSPAAWFADASAADGPVHRESAFDDFACQPLLPNMLSRMGPGVTWTDFDGDGDDDLALGAGRGDTLALMANQDGRLSRVDAADPGLVVPLDATALLRFPSFVGPESWFVSLSQLEEPRQALLGVFLHAASNGWTRAAALNDPAVVAGPPAAADVDGDGDLDLFVGGRARVCQYPEAANSTLLLNGGNSPSETEAWNLPLRGLGLVSGAVFTDIDADGRPDLALACEWGPVRLLRNTGTNFTDVTAAMGLGDTPGWWNSIHTGDFDRDGRLDLVAGNWGENSKYGRSPPAAAPLEIHHGDLDGNGTWDVVEAHIDKFTKRLVPERGLSCSSRAMPFVRERTPTFRLFGDADLPGIYGGVLGQARVVRCRELRSMVFLNRGDRFEARPLPMQAQWAPVFGLGVADFDADGATDLFLAQNFHATQVEAPRNDAGRGLLLAGDGTGGFRVLRSTESGVAIDAEQRGAAVADVDGDGRADLAVGLNDGPLRVLRNRSERRGLRVRLAGPPGNPDGIGAVLRPVTSGNPAPAVAVTMGASYVSCDSPVRVVTSPEAITELDVCWPGGARRVVQVPPDARELRVAAAP